MNSSLVPQSSEYPKVYKFKWDKPSELQSLFETVILKDVPVSRVKEEMVKYVTTIIEPVGWRAIWRTDGQAFRLTECCDFEVEIIDVSRSALEATVVVQRLLWPEMDTINEEEETIISNVISDKLQTAPLVELYVISEEDTEAQEFTQTAMIVEHVRFFFKHLWRPWDEMSLSDGQDIFVEDYLQPRLALYFDAQSKLISDSTVRKISAILKEGWKIKKRLDELNKRVERDADEEIIDESDMYESMRLRLKLEHLEKLMEILEDPYSRAVVSSIDLVFNDEVCLNKQKGNPQIFVVSEDYNRRLLKMVDIYLQKEHVSDDFPLWFHSSINKALKEAHSGDRILILPGTYTCDCFEWIDFDVKIDGIGENPSDVVVQANDAVGDIFVNCSSASVEFSNLTLRVSAETKTIVMAHSGSVKLDNCILDGEQAETTLLHSPSARVSASNCNITQGEMSRLACSSDGDGRFQMELDNEK